MQWKQRVIRPPPMLIKREVILKQREEAVIKLRNDVVDFRGVSWDYLEILWEDIKTKKKYRDIELYTMKDEKGNIETYRKIDEDDQRYLLLYPGGNNTWVEKKNCTKKKREEWSVWDVSWYCIRTPNVTRATNTPVAFVETLFTREQGEPFQGSYVIVPNECSFNSLMSSLERHFRKRLEKIKSEQSLENYGDSYSFSEETIPETDANFFVWLEMFSVKKKDFALRQRRSRNINHTPDRKKTMNEIRMTPLYHYVTEISRDMIGLFDERLVFVDDWKKPTVLTRSWCLWEIYCALSSFKHFHLIHDRELGDNFYNILSDTDTHKINSNLTVASQPNALDEDNILLNISNLAPSFAKCNNKVHAKIIREALVKLPRGFTTLIGLLKKLLCKYIAIKIDDDVSTIMKRQEEIHRKKGKIGIGICVFLNKVGIFMRNFGELNASHSYLSTALQLYLAQNNLSPDEAEMVIQSLPLLYISIAKTRILQNNFDDSLDNLKKAYEASDRVENVGIRNRVAVDICLVEAQVYLAKNDFERAVKLYTQLRENYRTNGMKMLSEIHKSNAQFASSSYFDLDDSSTRLNFEEKETKSEEVIRSNTDYQTLETRKVRLAIALAGIYKDKLNMIADAESCYREALEALEVMEMTKTLEYGQAQLGLAELRMRKQNFPEASIKFTACLELFIKYLGFRNPIVAEVYRKRGICRQSMGDKKKSKSDFRVCQDIYEHYYGANSEECKQIKEEISKI